MKLALTEVFIVVLVLLSPYSAAEDKVLWRDTLTSEKQAEFEGEIQVTLQWIVNAAHRVHFSPETYQMPEKLPDIYVVSRSYILKNKEEICHRLTNEYDINQCAEKILSWIDDERRLYVLRKEDVVQNTDLLISGIPTDLWIRIARTHELAHFIQFSSRKELKATTLPCETLSQFETEAFKLEHWWLHSLQSIDAERVNAYQRGKVPQCSCTNNDLTCW